jgi:sRNA-binding regulator protein Hfq
MEIDLTGDPSLIGLLPTTVILISAIIYYFGVRWGETHVEEYNVASQYFAGILFMINFVLKPYVVIYGVTRFIEFIFELFSEYNTFQLSFFKSEINLFLNYLQYLLIIIPYFLIVLEYLILRFIRLNVKKFEEMRKSLVKFYEFDCTKIKVWEWLLLESTPYLVAVIIYGLYELNEIYKLSIPLIILPSFLIAFLIFTNLAFCEGYCEAHYPKGNIYCKNGRIIEGIILKYANYVYLLTENEKCLINRDDISYIEERENSKKLCIKYLTFAYFQEHFIKKK